MEYVAWGMAIMAVGVGLAFLVGGACRLGATDPD